MFDEVKTMLNSLGVNIYEDLIKPEEAPPAKYIVYTDSKYPHSYSDGKPNLWGYEIQLDIFDDMYKNKELANSVETILDNNNISYTRLQPIYYSEMDKVQVAFLFTLI